MVYGTCVNKGCSLLVAASLKYQTKTFLCVFKASLALSISFVVVVLSAIHGKIGSNPQYVSVMQVKCSIGHHCFALLFLSISIAQQYLVLA